MKLKLGISILVAMSVQVMQAINLGQIQMVDSISTNIKTWLDEYANKKNKHTHAHFVSNLKQIVADLGKLKGSICKDNTKLTPLFSKIVNDLYQEIQKIYTVLERHKKADKAMVSAIIVQLYQQCSTIEQIVKNMESNLSLMITHAKQEQPELAENLLALKKKIKTWTASCKQPTDFIPILTYRLGCK
jgi:ferritin-like metal-binding protein YciE